MGIRAVFNDDPEARIVLSAKESQRKEMAGILTLIQ